MACGFWNTHGFSVNNFTDTFVVREAIIQYLDLDIIGLAETHLVRGAVLNIDGYTWFGHNRLHLHARARTGSGGVGFLVRDALLVDYDVSVLDKDYEGILWLQLKSKVSRETLSVCVCYVSPEHSTRDVDMSDFLDTLLMQIHQYQSEGQFFVCGDFNSRLGDRQDFIIGVDDVPDREVIDLTRNHYGELFCDFLVNVNCCVLNGRGLSSQNDYTSVRRQGGVAVVDYCLVPYDSLGLFTNFEVKRANDLFEQADCLAVADPTHSIPDHSALTWVMETCTPHQRSSTAVDNVCTQPPVPCTRFDTRDIPSAFMNNPQVSTAVDTLVERLRRVDDAQQAIDDIYSDFCGVVKGEMENYLPKRTMLLNGANSNKKRRVK